MARTVNPYETPAPNFHCMECGKSSNLVYDEQKYEIKCTGCNVRYSIEEISNMAAIGEPFWITKDRRAMPMRSMTDSHLNNCIAKVIREPDWRPGSLEKLITELEKRRGREDAAA